MKVAVVGHVEWVDFLHVERAPQTGEIIQATDAWQAAAGGGSDAAVQLRKLAGSATLYTALGDDTLGRRASEELIARGVRVEAAWRDDPQRRAVCFLDEGGERTIALLGPKLVPRAADPLPWHELEDCGRRVLHGRRRRRGPPRPSREGARRIGAGATRAA